MLLMAVIRDVVLRGPDDNLRRTAVDFDKITLARNKLLLSNLGRLRVKLSDRLAMINCRCFEGVQDGTRGFVVGRRALLRGSFC